MSLLSWVWWYTWVESHPESVTTPPTQFPSFSQTADLKCLLTQWSSLKNKVSQGLVWGPSIFCKNRRKGRWLWKLQVEGDANSLRKKRGVGGGKEMAKEPDYWRSFKFDSNRIDSQKADDGQIGKVQDSEKFLKLMTFGRILHKIKRFRHSVFKKEPESH